MELSYVLPVAGVLLVGGAMHAQGEVPPTDAINAFATGGRLVPSLDPELPDQPRQENARPRSRRSPRYSSDQFALDTIDVPADPRAAARRAPATATASSTKRHDWDEPTSVPTYRAIMVDTVNRDGTKPGAYQTPLSSSSCRQQLDQAGDRWIVVFSHNPLTEGSACRSSTATRSVVASTRRQLTQEPHRPTRALLADQHLEPSPTSPAVAHVPPARRGRGRHAGDLDGRPRRQGLTGVSRELAFLDAQAGGHSGSRAGARIATHVCSSRAVTSTFSFSVFSFKWLTER